MSLFGQASTGDATGGMLKGGTDAAVGTAAMSNPITGSLYAAYKLYQLASPFIKANQAAKMQAQQADAYDSYANDIKGERLQGRNQMQDFYKIGDANFNAEANTALPELGQMTADTQSQGTEAQQEYIRNQDALNATHGVRGGQAATLTGRGLGKLTTDIQRQINEMAYKEAANRQNKRLDYYNEQAMVPYRSLSNIQWWQPGFQEANAKNSGISTRYAQPTAQ